MLATWALFLTIAAIVFGIVMLVTSPAAGEAPTSRRLREVLKSHDPSRRTAELPSDTLPMADQELPSALPVIIQNTKLFGILRRLILQSHMQVTITLVVEITAALAFVGFVIAWHFTDILPLALAVAVGAGLLPLAYLYYRRNKWLTSFNMVLPECIETFARSLRAGQSVIASLDIVAQQVPAPANAEFAEVFKKQRYGLPLRDALHQMIERVPSMDLKIMVTALLVQRETGGNLPIVFDRLVAVIRDRLRIQREIKIHTAQGRLTGWVLGLLPLFLMLAINWISPNYSTPFFHDPMGQHLLEAGVGLLAIGVLFIRRIVSGIEV